MLLRSGGDVALEEILPRPPVTALDRVGELQGLADVVAFHVGRVFGSRPLPQHGGGSMGGSFDSSPFRPHSADELRAVIERRELSPGFLGRRASWR